MNDFIILNKHGIEHRRQYLRDVRFIDTQSGERGATAAGVDYNSMVYLE